MLSYNLLVFDVGYDGDAIETAYGKVGQGIQEVRDGRETNLLTLAGEPIDFPRGQGYGCSIVVHDIHPAWAEQKFADEEARVAAVTEEAQTRQFEAAVEQMRATLQAPDGNLVLKSVVDQSVAEALLAAKEAAQG